jgi:FAD/FMN-containing dehydrogenase
MAELGYTEAEDAMELIAQLAQAIGERNVLTGGDRAGYLRDWTGRYPSDPLAVIRPGSTEEVSACVKLAAAAAVPVVPVAGNTGLNGGARAAGELMLSLDRMTRIREIRPAAQIAIVDAGVILSNLHDAAEAEGLVFPMTFGARGSCRIGGMLSTNAGGSNVLRYGNSRELCLGVEVVLADGRVLDLMSELRKDNTGYDLRDLFIGAEGTLGIITGAVLRLHPKPRAYATAMLAVPSMDEALTLLNRLQQATGGAVEAFEYMPADYIDAHLAHFPEARPPFEARHPINILVEVGATAPRDATPAEDGSVPIQSYLEEELVAMIESGAALDAVVAQNEAQRREMWARREAAGELTFAAGAAVITDVALPLDQVGRFLDEAERRIETVMPGARDVTVAHLGDGNVHYAVLVPDNDAETLEAILQVVEDLVNEMGGSFSAEHGIGLSKKGSMQRQKDPLALELMRRIKETLDPQNLMNPGKVLP